MMSLSLLTEIIAMMMMMSLSLLTEIIAMMIMMSLSQITEIIATMSLSISLWPKNTAYTISGDWLRICLQQVT